MTVKSKFETTISMFETTISKKARMNSERRKLSWKVNLQDNDKIGAYFGDDPFRIQTKNSRRLRSHAARH